MEYLSNSVKELSAMLKQILEGYDGGNGSSCE